MTDMQSFTYANPEFFWLLALIPFVLAWHFFSFSRAHPGMVVPDSARFSSLPATYKKYLRHLPALLRCAAIAAIAIVLARPQSTDSWENSTTYGIDIMLALDISSSMLAEDLKPNRLEASKNVAMSFISSRPYDRIGLVIFSGETFTQCPLTTDQAVLLNLFREVKCGMIEDGTAIGMGLATSVARLRESGSKSKIVILLTDGMSNQGEIDPMTAAEIAQTFGVRVYTVGVGTRGLAPYPVETPFGKQYRNMEVDIDEPMLKEIARLTGGAYFRATDNESLKGIYEEIDKLEKSRVEVNKFSRKNEEFKVFALLALLMLLAEFLLRRTVLRTLP
jgi:Ca-activated chloride channel homolog